jgi:asparagine synthase (glutamine-hydrolysing)
MKGRADFENFDRAVKTLGQPVEHSQINVHMSALRQSEALGIRTMLSGYGGDEIVTNQARAFELELYNKRQFKTLAGELPGGVFTSRLRFVKRFYDLRWRDTFSKQFYYILERKLRVSPVRREVIEELGIIDDQKAQISYAAQAETLNEQALRGLAFRRSRVGRLEASAVMAQSHRVEYRWPLYDRQIMQLYLQTPAIEKRHKAMGRYLHRRAVVGTIPNAIAWQQSKNMGNLVKAAISPILPDLLDEASAPPHLKTILDFEKLRSMHADIQKAPLSGTISEQFIIQTIALWSSLALARWLDP